jgi:hypothetical protein
LSSRKAARATRALNAGVCVRRVRRADFLTIVDLWGLAKTPVCPAILGQTLCPEFPLKKLFKFARPLLLLVAVNRKSPDFLTLVKRMLRVVTGPEPARNWRAVGPHAEVAQMQQKTDGFGRPLIDSSEWDSVSRSNLKRIIASALINKALADINSAAVLMHQQCVMCNH